MLKIYVSKYKNFTVTVLPAIEEMVNGVRFVRDNGKSISFSNGRYTTSDPKTIELLEQAKSFGVDFHDLLKQENEAKKAIETVKSGLVQIVEGARSSTTQFAGQTDTGGTLSQETKAVVEKRKPGRPKTKGV